MRKTRSLIGITALVATLMVPATASSGGWPPQAARGVTVPAGFVARVFGQLENLPTSLTWGPSTATSGTATTAGQRHHGILLYVTATRNPFGSGGEPVLDGKVYAFEDEGAVPKVVADNLAAPLGIVMGPDETLYVAENANSRGRITALRDNDGDGVFESRRTVLKNLPNGRHQTNGMTFGSDGKLYVANGNATDDGIECGPNLGPKPPVPLPSPLKELYEQTFRNQECADPEIKPWSGAILRVDTTWNDVDLLKDIRVDDDRTYADDGMDDESVLVSPGYRNIYDVDFDPLRPNMIWTPMNGSDDPSSSEPLYAVDTTNEEIVGYDEETEEPIYGPIVEDAGFPSCLYDPHVNAFPEPQPPPPIGSGHDHPGTLEPEDNLNEEVLAKFGACPKDTVHRPEWIFGEGHEGTSGAAFQRGGNFPQRYRGDLFVAEWGSLWNLNGMTVTGHKVLHFDLDEDRKVVREREFMTGVLPIDVTFGPNGYLYVADMSGQIYEVRHVADTPEVVQVDIRCLPGTGTAQFVPALTSVVRGQTVQWTNLCSTPQNVTGEHKVKDVNPLPGGGGESPYSSGSRINSGPIPPGGTHSHTFDGETAVYHYHSTVTALDGHTARGTIVVTPLER